MSWILKARTAVMLWWWYKQKLATFPQDIYFIFPAFYDPKLWHHQSKTHLNILAEKSCSSHSSPLTLLWGKAQHTKGPGTHLEQVGIVHGHLPACPLLSGFWLCRSNSATKIVHGTKDQTSFTGRACSSVHAPSEMVSATNKPRRKWLFGFFPQ